MRLSGRSRLCCLPFKKIIVWLSQAVFELTYRVGYAVYRCFCLFKQLLLSHIKKTSKSFHFRLTRFRKTRPAMNLMIFVIVLLLPFGLIEVFRLAADAVETKDRALQFTALGLEKLQQAKNDLNKQDFQSAGNSFLLAERSFKTSKENLSQMGSLLGGLVNLIPIKRQADLLLDTASLAAQVGSEFSFFAEQVNQLQITPAGFVTTGDFRFSELTSRMETSLMKIGRGFELINENLKNIDPNILPVGYRENFVEKTNSFQELMKNFQNLKNLFKIFRLTFDGQSQIFVLLENNNELRPTGGFIGSFASLNIDNGSIKSLKVDSIYALDGQLQENIVPPEPIFNVNNRWYLRDANWFVDFPSSAKKLSTFYEKEGGETPDIVIAVTPNLIIDLLRLTGPVEMPKYGVTLNPDNFVELTQVVSSDYATMPENKPKQILADLVPILFDRLAKLSDVQKPDFLAALQKNLNEKHILLYSRNSQLQNLYETFGWSGKVLDTDRDYLAVVNANLGATKSDLAVEQKIKLETEISSDGTITNRLTISRHNSLPELDQTFNDSFIRVLVPEGSKLLENQGFDYRPLGMKKPFNQKTDDEVMAWEKGTVRDVVSGTLIGSESGKTFFGNWQKLTGGQTRNIVLVYQLPFKLKDVDRYSLLLQKQAGALNQSFTQEVRFEDRKLEWSNFQPQNLTANSYSQTLELNRDQMLGAVFVHR